MTHQAAEKQDIEVTTPKDGVTKSLDAIQETECGEQQQCGAEKLEDYRTAILSEKGVLIASASLRNHVTMLKIASVILP